MSPHAAEVHYDTISPPSRNEVQKFFEPAVDTIVECVKEITAGTDPANTVIVRCSLRKLRRLTASQFVFLAGGFGASPWIFQEVGREIAAQGLRLSRPDTHTYVFLPPSLRVIYM